MSEEYCKEHDWYYGPDENIHTVNYCPYCELASLRGELEDAKKRFNDEHFLSDGLFARAQRAEKECEELRGEVEEYIHQSNQNFHLMQEYRTAILSLGIDFFRDDAGVLLDSVEMGGRLRGLFGKLAKERDSAHSAGRREAGERCVEIANRFIITELCQDTIHDIRKAHPYRVIRDAIRAEFGGEE